MEREQENGEGDVKLLKAKVAKINANLFVELIEFLL